MRPSRFALFVAPLALALGAAPALAHGALGGACLPLLQELCPNVTPGPGPGGYHACLKTLCGPATPGPGGLVSCLLKQSATSKFPNCEARLTKMQAKIAAWQTAFNTACVTTNDVSTFCNNVTTGPWSQVRCLRQAVKDNKAVSATCQAFLAQHHGHRHREHACHGRAAGSCSNQ
jgi:hypothetical protein